MDKITIILLTILGTCISIGLLVYGYKIKP